jgi:integrase
MTDQEKQSRSRRGMGSVYQRKSDGRWCGELSRTTESGLREKMTVTAMTRPEALTKLDEARASWRKSVPARRRARMTVSLYMDRWLDKIKSRVAPNTYLGREAHVRLHIKPAIGGKRLDRLDASSVERMLYDIVQAKHLSALTAAHVRTTLRIALGQAQRDGLVHQNVAALAKGPPVKTREMKTLDAEAVRALIDRVSGTDEAALWLTAITTGVRAGELAGLQWGDVDLDGGALHVHRSWARQLDGSYGLQDPKTDKSKREIPLLPETVEALKVLRDKAALLGQADAANAVFTDAADQRIGTTKLASRLRVLLKQAGLRQDIRFHDLRHSVATLWLTSGVDIKTVADLLGHSTAVTTMNVYAHSNDERKQDAVERLREAIASG